MKHSYGQEMYIIDFLVHVNRARVRRYLMKCKKCFKVLLYTLACSACGFITDSGKDLQMFCELFVDIFFPQSVWVKKQIFSYNFRFLLEYGRKSACWARKGMFHIAPHGSVMLMPQLQASMTKRSKCCDVCFTTCNTTLSFAIDLLYL